MKAGPKSKSPRRSRENKEPDKQDKKRVFQSVKRKLFSQHPSLYFWGALTLFILPVCLAKIYDPDIWWHMQLGRSMLENMGPPDYSKFYFGPIIHNYSDLRFTWLGDIFLYGVHLMGGDVGLQFLRIGVVLLSCVLLKSMAGSKYSGWHLLMLMLFVVGTYQKQLIRNSLFSLIFTTLLFWLWNRIRYENREKLLCAFPVLMGVWGCMHGSYLLGFGLMSLIFAGDWIDSLRGLNPGKKRFTFQYAAVIFISLALISIWNPLTGRFFGIHAIKKLITYDTGDTNEKSVSADNPAIVAARDGCCVSMSSEIGPRKQNLQISSAGLEMRGVVDFLSKIKNALNNTIFKQNNSLLRSADFTSPFDRLDRMYVKVGLLLGLAGTLLLAFFSRPVRFSNLAPFAAILFFGLGYLRMTGYIPTITAALFFTSCRNGELTLKFGDKWVKAICVAALIAMYANLASGFKITVGTELHAFGFGRIPTFSKEGAEKILENHRDENTLTTIMNGGFLLYHWYPLKKVFLDGFFAPHPFRIFDDYTKLIRGTMNPDRLVKKYGIQIAVIEQNKASLNNVFLESPNWHVRYIDNGNIVYFHHSRYNSKIPVPSILSDQASIHDLPYVYRERFAKYLLLIQNSLIENGRVKDLAHFKRNYAELIQSLSYLMGPAEKNYIDSLMARYVQAYGVVNSKTISYEMLHFKAAETGDLAAVEKFGRLVLKESPNRFPVLFNLASVHASHRDVEKSKTFLKKLTQAARTDRSFWDENRFNIAKLCLNLFYMEKKQGRRLSAYELLSEAHFADDSVISKEKLYEEGIKLVREENSRGHAAAAYDLFRIMEKDFPENGRFYNEMAWHILANRDKIFEGPETAAMYAKKAVDLMEKNRDPIIDTAYDTLAEAYFQMKEYDKMVEYEKSAMRVAPPNRKKLYKHRPRQEDNG